MTDDIFTDNNFTVQLSHNKKHQALLSVYIFRVGHEAFPCPQVQLFVSAVMKHNVAIKPGFMSSFWYPGFYAKQAM